MRDTFLPFSPPFITEEEIAEVVDTLRTDWITTGPKTKLFEADFKKYVNAADALALNSCTAGLHTALVTLGIGRGDEVITTSMTFAATANVIEHAGAKTVFVDVEPDTLNLDPAQVAAAITKRTKAIIVVHYAGHPVELDAINQIAAENHLAVIEDAAHALPAKYKGRVIGSGSNPTAFSFYATKNMTTSEGGMLIGDPEFISRARMVSLHGMSRDAWKRYDKGGSWFYEVEEPGFKYNMTDIQASLGLVQLKRLDSFQGRRREIVEQYRRGLGGLEELLLPVERSHVESAWHLFVLRLRLESLNINRNQFIEELTKRQIGTSVHFIPVHLHPYYAQKYDLHPEQFPVAYSNYLRMLSLPLNPRMTDQDVSDVTEAVHDIVRANRR